ncbi:MAG TPA: hypothetical protein VG452_13450 [Egibacteraceae bacterium]|nr:DUF3052 domain-containing protein [Actinomycetota bacterium]HWB73213.1 hypothetical protein [Egibacteraceae bacterium]
MSASAAGTPLARKLGLRPGQAVAVLGRPEGWAVADLPLDVAVHDHLVGHPDVVIAFVTTLSELQRRLSAVLGALHAQAALWVAWPRRAAGHRSGVTEQALRDLLLPTGLVDVKVAALGDDWSGLKFVWRRQLRAALPGR